MGPRQPRLNQCQSRQHQSSALHCTRTAWRLLPRPPHTPGTATSNSSRDSIPSDKTCHCTANCLREVTKTSSLDYLQPSRGGQPQAASQPRGAGSPGPGAPPATQPWPLHLSPPDVQSQTTGQTKPRCPTTTTRPTTTCPGRNPRLPPFSWWTNLHHSDLVPVVWDPGGVHIQPCPFRPLGTFPGDTQGQEGLVSQSIPGPGTLPKTCTALLHTEDAIPLRRHGF